MKKNNHAVQKAESRDERNKMIDELAARFEKHEAPSTTPSQSERTMQTPIVKKSPYIRKTWFCSKETVKMLNRGYLDYLTRHDLSAEEFLKAEYIDRIVRHGIAHADDE